MKPIYSYDGETWSEQIEREVNSRKRGLTEPLWSEYRDGLPFVIERGEQLLKDRPVPARIQRSAFWTSAEHHAASDRDIKARKAWAFGFTFSECVEVLAALLWRRPLQTEPSDITDETYVIDALGERIDHFHTLRSVAAEFEAMDRACEDLDDGGAAMEARWMVGSAHGNRGLADLGGLDLDDGGER